MQRWGIGIPPSLSLTAISDLAQQAEAAGAESLWVADIGRDIFFEQINILQVPVRLLVIEPVAYDEAVCQDETDLVGCNFDSSPLLFVDKNTGSERARMSLIEQVEKKTEGEAGVENCIDEDYILPGDIVVEILKQANRPGRLSPVAIAAHLDEIHFDWHLHLAHEVSGEEKGPLQDADNEGFALGKGIRKSLGKLSDAQRDFASGVQPNERGWDVHGIHKTSKLYEIFSTRCVRD